MGECLLVDSSILELAQELSEFGMQRPNVSTCDYVNEPVALEAGELPVSIHDQIVCFDGVTRDVLGDLDRDHCTIGQLDVVVVRLLFLVSIVTASHSIQHTLHEARTGYL